VQPLCFVWELGNLFCPLWIGFDRPLDLTGKGSWDEVSWMLSGISNCAEVCLLILVGYFARILMPSRVYGAGSRRVLLDNLEFLSSWFDRRGLLRRGALNVVSDLVPLVAIDLIWVISACRRDRCLHIWRNEC